MTDFWKVSGVVFLALCLISLSQFVTMRLDKYRLQKKKNAITSIKREATDPLVGVDLAFIGLVLTFLIFFIFLSFGLLWVLSVEGNNLIGFWAYIFSFFLILSAFFYMENRGMFDL